jgi:hypothetical protein
MKCKVQSIAVSERGRRGSALMLVLIMTMVIASLAMSAIFLTSSSAMLSRSFNKERDLRYAAEAGLAMGKSRLNNDPYALPDSLFATIVSAADVTGADGSIVPGMKVSVYAGPTGSTTGQFGRFASVLAVASDAAGPRLVRRLELAQENFSKFAYWTNSEKTASGGTIYFANQDNLWGPVWSNDDINIASSGATFHDEVGTAKSIFGKTYGNFIKGYTENAPAIVLPDNAALSKLPGYATSGGFNFTAPTSGDENTVRFRIEFVNIDLDGNGDATGVDEGFFRVYQANNGETAWLRADYTTTLSNAHNCGDFHPAGPTGTVKFFPASAHATTWFRQTIDSAPGVWTSKAKADSAASLTEIMSGSGHDTGSNSRCLPGGDPQLVAIERKSSGWGNAGKKGGEDSTFTASGDKGHWKQWTGAVDPRLPALRTDANYLFPLYRGQNPGTKGVIYVNGTVAISGTLRGRVTIHSNSNIVILDDFRYASDPASPNFRCSDVLGIIASNDVVVANNALNTPIYVNGSYRVLDDQGDVYIHAVLMAIGTSFRVEDYSSGPDDARKCGGIDSGRGCLFVTGGLIQARRGAVGLTDGTGFIKRYAYDRCANYNPPPYFPTTGRFLDNRYYELDPVQLDVAQIFQLLTPG